MENRRKKMTKKENFTINIAQESCEHACIIDYQTNYNTPCTIALCNLELSQIQPSNPSTRSATNLSNNYSTNQQKSMKHPCNIYMQNEEVVLS